MQPVQPRKRRWLVGLCVLAGLFLGLRLLNWVWPSWTMPRDFPDANWQGHWESEGAWLVAGKLMVKLPEPIPQDEEFETEAIAFYDLWSLYNPGGSLRMKVVGKLNNEGSTGTARESAAHAPQLFLKMKAGSGSQSITYVATLDRQAGVLTGATAQGTHRIAGRSA